MSLLRTIVLTYATVPLKSNARNEATPVSSDWLVVGAPAGSAKNVMFFAVSMISSEVGDGVSNCATLDAIATGLAPPGKGADCSAPTPVVSTTPVSQYQRAPLGETIQLLTPVATVARLASLPSVCVFSTSAPETVGQIGRAH